MYDALLEHSLSAGIVGKDLSGEDFLLEQTKPIDEKCKRSCEDPHAIYYL